MDEFQKILTAILCSLVFILFICPLCLCIIRACNNEEIHNKQINSGDEETYDRQFSRESDCESDNPIWQEYDSNEKYVRFEDNGEIVQ